MWSVWGFQQSHPERERQGLSLTELAERGGIDRATISKFETGKIPNPTIGALKKDAAALGKSLSWTLDEASDTPRRTAPQYVSPNP